MRPTGRLHLGHYYSVLKHWVALQHTQDCYFFVADLHALTTEYEKPQSVSELTISMISEWIACGIDPDQCVLFVQSWVREHAELQLLLSMITPLSWLERIPSYKDQLENQKGKSLDTLGFLSYPLLQTADILLYKANVVPVGADQIAHIEFAREVARRFNYLFGGGELLQEKTEDLLSEMKPVIREAVLKGRKRYREFGDFEALQQTRTIIFEQTSLTVSDRERLLGFLEGSGQKILPEPEASILPQAKFLGLDGKKMSKSAGNTILLNEHEKGIEYAFSKMPTDPARKLRSDPGNPDNCPVWEYHMAVSNEETKKEINLACRKATIGCVDCKKKIAKSVNQDIAIIRDKIIELEDRKDTIRDILKQGTIKATHQASETMEQIRGVFHLLQ